MRVRLHSFRARTLLACVPALGLVLMAGAGTASASHAPANSRAELRTALEHLLANWHPTNHAVGGSLASTKVRSLNWSGYADTGTGFSTVTGNWTQPTVTGCSATGPQEVEVFWVGIDGVSKSDPTVEQTGTGAACGSGVGPLVYFTWWEQFPANNIQVVGTSVKAGDKISASVVRSGTSYAFKVTDSTTSNNNVSTSTSCSSSTCKDQSAEWIAERVQIGSTLSALPKFGTWTPGSATVKAGSKSGTIKTFPNNEYTMVDNSNKVLAQPGALNTTGNSFKDVWKASS